MGMAEIGIADAQTSTALLRRHQDLYMYLVDIAPMTPPAKGLLHTYRGHFTFMKQPSVEAAKLIQKDLLDLVYIDGDHSYEAVREDIKAWLPKIRRGGIISGHDYHIMAVARAVNEFAVSRDV